LPSENNLATFVEVIADSSVNPYLLVIPWARVLAPDRFVDQQWFRLCFVMAVLSALY